MANTSKYKTLVFFDLETTGLPQETRPEITELSMVAVSLEHFLSTPVHKLPRVLHKLTLCVNPGKSISPEVINVTGFDNFLLENEGKFDKSSLQLIIDFCHHVQQPICFVAHNGGKFDFPIFNRYFTQHKMLFPVDCVDSLNIFRRIETKNDQHVDAFIKTELTAISSSSSKIENQENTTYEGRSSPDLFDMPEDSDFTERISQVMDKVEQEYSLSLQSFNELTPSKRTRNDVPPKPLPKKRNITRIGNHSKVIPLQLVFSKSYKLNKIYERFFERPPENCHRAEDDAITLLKCAQTSSMDFLRLIPEYVKPLSEYTE